MESPIRIGTRTYLIDGLDLGLKGRTGTYVLWEEEITLIETGPSPSVPHLLEGLKQLDISPIDVKYIILTHIHLDHAGGAGLLLKDCPNAKVVVHERGKRHLTEPSRLIAGAKAVYGDAYDQLFAPVLPIAEERLLTKKDGDTLTIGSTCTLTFYDTPGHAKHHLGIYDSFRKGVFTGDTAGIRYHQTEDAGLTFYLPTTSPNQFDPDAMKESIERFRSMNPDRLYFGHFGESTEPEVAFNQVNEWIARFVEMAEQAIARNEGVKGIQDRLYEIVSHFLTDHHVPVDHPVYHILKIDFEICAIGLADYIKKRNK